MKKVLILNSLYYPNVGGVENSIKEMSNEFIKLGYSVHIVCSNSNFSTTDVLLNDDYLDGAHVQRYDSTKGYLKTFSSCIKLLKKIKKNGGFDLVISRGYVTSFCCFFAGIKKINYIVPSIILIQDKSNLAFKFGLIKFFRTLFSGFIQLFSIFISKVYVFSESMDKQIKEVTFGFVSATKVNPGLNTERFTSTNRAKRNKLRKSFKVPLDSFTILCLGRFSEVKQFHLALETIKELHTSHKDINLVLVGSGSELDNYKNYIKVHSLEKFIQIFQQTKKPENFYQMADCFLMLSRYESFGQVLLEASASSLPVIALKPGPDIITSVDKIYTGFEPLVKYSNNATPEEIGKKVLIITGISGSNHEY